MLVEGASKKCIWRWTNKEKAVDYSALKEEGNPVLCDNTDEPGGHYAKWNEPVFVKLREADNRTMVNRGQEEGEVGSFPVGMKFRLCKVNLFYRWSACGQQFCIMHLTWDPSSKIVSVLTINKTHTGTQENTKVMGRSITLILWWWFPGYTHLSKHHIVSFQYGQFVVHHWYVNKAVETVYQRGLGYKTWETRT